MAVGSLSTVGSNIYLNHILRSQQKAAHTPYLAAFITTPTKNGAGAEPSGGGYARLQMDSADWSSPSAGSITTVNDLVFNRSTGWVGTVVGLGIYDSAVGGNYLAYYQLADGEIVENNDGVVILAGGLTHSFVSGFWSQTLQHNILSDLYKSVPLPVYASLFAATYTTAPAPAVSPTAGGTEPTDAAYIRQPVPTNGVGFSAPSNGTSSNAIQIAFPTATENQGTITHIGFHDAQTAGNYVLGGAVSPKAININDYLSVSVGGCVISLDAA